MALRPHLSVLWRSADRGSVCAGRSANSLMGQSARLCRWTRPHELIDAGQQSYLGLQTAVEFRLGKKALASFKISLALRSSLISRSKALTRSRSSLGMPSRTPVSTSYLRIQLRKVWAVHPVLPAIEQLPPTGMDAHPGDLKPFVLYVCVLQGKTY